VATFLVEVYEPRTHAPAEREARAHAATAIGGVRHVRSIFTPEDELCLHVFESPSRERLEQALEAAGFGYVRVTEAAEFPERSTP
jgi:hypothetical protein